MKLNFWQILGIVLLLAGASFLIYEKTGVKPANPVQPVAPAPLEAPSTQAAI